MEDNQDQIASFWEWFELNHSTLADIVSERDQSQIDFIVQKLDEYILSFGRLKWSVTNPSDQQFIFTISPNNDRELLRITSAIIRSAPQISNWKFHEAVQPDGNLDITLYDSQMDVQSVNAETWEFRLDPIANGRFNLIILVNETDHLDEDTEMIAVDLILTALLGERLKIEQIEELQIVDEFDTSDLPFIKPIQTLLESIS